VEPLAEFGVGNGRSHNGNRQHRLF
jgi:hypothetical protein